MCDLTGRYTYHEQVNIPFLKEQVVLYGLLFYYKKLKGNQFYENMENTDHVSNVGSFDLADTAAHLRIGSFRQRNGHQSNY